jgi:hypothetical protein
MNVALLWSGLLVGSGDVVGATTPTPAPGSGSPGDRVHEIRGFVIDQADEAVPGAILTLEGADLSVEADERGTFRFEDVPAGRYALSVRSSCEVTAYVPEVAVPRPIQVPLPVRAHRFDCLAGTGHAISGDDQARLVERSLHHLVRTGSHPLVAALLGDDAIRLELRPVAASPGALPRELTLPEGTPVPIHPVEDGPPTTPPDGDRSAAMRLQFCLERAKPGLAHVRVTRTTPSMAADVEVLWAGEALFSFVVDDSAEGGWRVVHQLFCLDEVPAEASPKAPTDAPIDPGSSPGGG